MKTLMTFFSALALSSALMAQTNLLGSGINAPAGTGNGVGSQPFTVNPNIPIPSVPLPNVPAQDNPLPTPSLNESTINDSVAPVTEEIQSEEDTRTFSGGVSQGVGSGIGPGAGSGNGVGTGTGVGNDTGPGIGDPASILP